MKNPVCMNEQREPVKKTGQRPQCLTPNTHTNHPTRTQAAYRSVSAFSPIAHPSACPWGVKAFTGYLGEDRGAWAVSE